MPERIQLSRRRGWKMPQGTLKVDRSTPWGNPFRPDEPPGFLPLAQCLEKFETLARTWSLEPLRGKNLACWCPLTSPCHADILLRLANHVPTASLPPALQIVSEAGITFYEGEDYTTAAWQPGRDIVWHRLSYRILANEMTASGRLVKVAGLGANASGETRQQPSATPPTTLSP